MFSSVCSLPPRISFLLNSTHRPLVHFKLPDVHNTTTLLLSDDSSTLYVGARDAILSLDVSQVDAVVLKRKVTWRPTAGDMKECEDKGKNPQSVTARLFATSPLVSSLPVFPEPTFVGSSLDAAERKLYFFFNEVGKEFSFMDELRVARVAQVCKVTVNAPWHHVIINIKSRLQSVRTRPPAVQTESDSSTSRPLIGPFTASQCKRVLSSLICFQDDVGGQRTLQKKWTSFAKAPLLCRSPRQLPFNILQDVFSLPPPEGGDASDTLFYGVFTSQWSVGQQSAVCVFTLQDVRTAFAGRYRTLEMQTHQCNHVMGTHPFLGKCGLDAASDAELFEVKRSFLSSTEVKPATDAPLVVSSQHQFSRVAAMRTMAANGKWFTVLFLLTESGFVHKVVLLDQGPRVIEEIQVFTQPQLVKSIVLSSTKGVLYIGMSEGVTSVPVADCSVYTSCSRCVLARDPLCGWSLSSSACVRLDDRPELL
ncbi:hypothetical protein F2P81_016540 [Scophthalmus maximus]|uniref:Sema domain-containing protein n=1 Tax=Scophthalmus maximus TaxID=52904 RepID=A0A6A4SH99_SCOMX|nr:hypothetical protein F2P81_016540 [Scophthalmus maximus]